MNGGPKKLSDTTPETVTAKSDKHSIGLSGDDPVCDAKEVNIFLANLVYAFHVTVVLFVLIAPFSNIPAFLILHVTFSVSLLLHWYNNNNDCSLTYIESRLRGIDKVEGFTHKFIAPIYDISQTEWSRLCYIITIILMCVSIYYLYNSPKVAESLRCFSQRTENPEYNDLPLHKRVAYMFNCFRSLLIWC